MTHGEQAAPERNLSQATKEESTILPGTDYYNCSSPFRFLQPRLAVLLVGAVVFATFQKLTIHPVLSEPKTKEQIAEALSSSLRTLQLKLKKAELDVPRGYVSPETQNVIYERLGWKPVSQNGVKWREMS